MRLVGKGRYRWKEVEDEEERRLGGAMGGEGVVKLSTQFTQTALSARVEQLQCQMK